MDNLLFQLRGLAPLPPLVGLNWDVLFTLMAYDQAACICHPLQNSSPVGGLWAELVLPSLAQAALTLHLPCSGPTQSQLLLGLAVSHAAAFRRELLDCYAS